MIATQSLRGNADIKSYKEIKELSLFLAAHPGSVQSYRNLGNLIGVRRVNTVKNYLGALADVYLFQFIDLFDYSLKRQIYNPSKVYCVDAALAGSVSSALSAKRPRCLTRSG
jgi:predicted AAA+ superfamily ATPase